MLLHPIDCQSFTKAFFFVIEKRRESEKTEQFPQTDRTRADSSGVCALCPFLTGNSLMEIETGIYKKTVLLSVVVVVQLDVAIGQQYN